MDCPTCEAMVDAYLDGELSASDSAEFERALDVCPECRKRLETGRAMGGLLRELPLEPAPDLLKARIERELRAIGGATARPVTPGRTPNQTMRWMAMAAGLIVAVSVGWIGGTLSGRGGPGDDEMMSAYLRVVSSEHAVDVASTDRHTVKPWFAGRIAYSPPVYDLTAQGFPLEGGRVDVVGGRKVSVLVYHRNHHRIALSLWPSSSGDTPAKVTVRDGFAMADWRHAGFEMHAVSDIAPAEMSAFASALDKAIDADR